MLDYGLIAANVDNHGRQPVCLCPKHFFLFCTYRHACFELLAQGFQSRLYGNKVTHRKNWSYDCHYDQSYDYQ
ncbi:hypothetical protein AD928_00335 [Acetobacter cerevisiae]|uniref:Uncharacterized protein n=1 Tax=Acetobacter cerevisiae TaxID=178900 RepID=A0A149R134_9PROT|nr:hypothetical protein [Acetobacter cerevisiae]KXV03289.1 hypothetical protein AD928_00335 [Acetobacter cerevisiae]